MGSHQWLLQLEYQLALPTRFYQLQNMTSHDDTQLVVRNTFLEFVPKTAFRNRAFSDSCLSVLEGNDGDLRKSSLDDISNVSTNTPAEEVDQSLEDGTNASAIGDDSSVSGDSIDHFQQVTAPQSAMVPCPGTFWIPLQATVPGWCVVPCQQQQQQQQQQQDNAQQCWTTVMLKNIPNDYTQ